MSERIRPWRFLTLAATTVIAAALLAALLPAAVSAQSDMPRPQDPVLSWSDDGLSWEQPGDQDRVWGHFIFATEGRVHLATLFQGERTWEPPAEFDDVDSFVIMAFSYYPFRFSGLSNSVDRPDPFDPQNPFNGLPFSRGSIDAADYADNPDGKAVWKSVSNGSDPATYDYREDTQIIHRDLGLDPAGGDLLPALDGQIHTGYRYLTTEGEQSLWDRDNQPNSTRSQLGAWGRYSNLHISEEGTREFIVFSVRLDPDTPITGGVQSHDGLFHLSKVLQFKSLPGNAPPMISIDEARDGLQLIVNEPDAEKGKHNIRLSDVKRGVWLRIGIDVIWSTGSEGSYQWWGDLDGDNVRDFEPLSEQRFTPTISAGSDASAMNFGPYHVIEVEGDDRPWVPYNGREYANIEFFGHPIGDEWGEFTSN